MTHRILELKPGDDHPPFPLAADVVPLGDDDRTLHAPDSHLLVFDALDRVAARCSCWWRHVPPTDGSRIGIIGHYQASTLDAATTLLSHACERLARAGCARAIGPMDGSTWRTYRVVTDRGAAPPFFLEPWTPPAWLDHWTAAGFAPVAHYTSAATEDLLCEDPRVPRACARLTDAGVTIRSLDAGNRERDLKQIFTLAVECFGRNYLFAPIPESEFLDQNRRLLPYVLPELVLVAEHETRRSPSDDEGSRLCGFLFAVPDVLQAQRGGRVDTVIVKTVAVRPDPAFAGLGTVLVSRAQQRARNLGFRRAIHALIHDGNASRNISRRYALPIRRYALLGRALRP